MNRPVPNPMKVCVASVRFHSAPALKKWFPRTSETLSSTWMRVSCAWTGRKKGSPKR